MGIHPQTAASLCLALAMTMLGFGCTQDSGKNNGKKGGGDIGSIAFGKADEKPVMLFTLKNDNGMIAKITNYGGIVTELHVPDKDGKTADVVHGFDNLADYQKSSPYFGAIVGRVGNRIKNATFELDGKTYKLEANNGDHHLHGGKKGWDKVVWKAEPMTTDDGQALKLTYVSKDGEEGYPGTVTATVIYTLTKNNELKLDISATTDKATPLNIVHHTYWNLAGTGSGSIKDHELQLFAANNTPGDETLVPKTPSPRRRNRRARIAPTDTASSFGETSGARNRTRRDGRPCRYRRT